MLKLNIKNADGSLYGWKNIKDEAEAQSYIDECKAAGSLWTTETSGCTVELEDIGNAPLMEDLRNLRNMKLSLCDWTQLQDAPLSDEKKQEWAAYRQALRDLPALPDLDFENIPWPQKP